MYLQGRITLYLAKINQKNNGEHIYDKIDRQ